MVNKINLKIYSGIIFDL